MYRGNVRKCTAFLFDVKNILNLTLKRIFVKILALHNM